MFIILGIAVLAGCHRKPKPMLYGFALGDTYEQFSKKVTFLPASIGYLKGQQFNGDFTCWNQDVPMANDKSSCSVPSTRPFKGVNLAFMTYQFVAV